MYMYIFIKTPTCTISVALMQSLKDYIADTVYLHIIPD